MWKSASCFFLTEFAKAKHEARGKVGNCWCGGSERMCWKMLNRWWDHRGFNNPQRMLLLLNSQSISLSSKLFLRSNFVVARSIFHIKISSDLGQIILFRGIEFEFEFVIAAHAFRLSQQAASCAQFTANPSSRVNSFFLLSNLIQFAHFSLLAVVISQKNQPRWAHHINQFHVRCGAHFYALFTLVSFVFPLWLIRF